MERDYPVELYSQFDTPYFIVDRVLLEENLMLLKSVKEKSGARVLLALKGFAMFSAFQQVRSYLDGSCASSPHEARLAFEELGGELHSFAAAYSKEDFTELLNYSNHIIFNSLSLYDLFMPLALKNRAVEKGIKFGLRINPEHSETETPIYDPCAPGSRLGITSVNFPDTLPEYITGLHMHTLCEQSAEALVRTFQAAEKNFSTFFHKLEWLNLGGGHHITRPDYNIELLCTFLTEVREKYKLQIYLEPGEAVALNTGFLVATVLDIIDNGRPIAILDSAAPAHTPDVIEMPYRPFIIGSGEYGEKKYSYRIGGLSCLAGDVFGDYSFDGPLSVGQKIVFTDMAHYSMVKTNTFNGIKLPDIYYYDSSLDQVLHHKSFGYSDFKERLS